MQIVDLIQERGPLTVAAFMDLALYHPQLGYYARAARRSGRGGDFFTSVDVGPLFGELIAEQVAQMARLLAAGSTAGEPCRPRPASPSLSEAALAPFDLVEAGAADGQLARDVLEALRRRHPDVYERARVHLVETSGAARSAHLGTLGEVGERLATSSPSLPDGFEGILLANELFDAMPVHQVVMREDGLREVYVAAGGGELTTLEGPPSTPALGNYLADHGAALEPGWRAEVNLCAERWVRDAAARMRRGFMLLIDYGHESRELYSASHSAGTLTTFSGHRSAGTEVAVRRPPWLERPGELDITSHVNFTSMRTAIQREGFETLAFLDQTYFVIGLATGIDVSDGARRRAMKTLLMPGGLGSTMKVLIAGRGVGTPELSCCLFSVRAT